MKKKWISVVVIVIIIAFIGFNIWNSKRTTTATVETATLQEETMKDSVMAPGALQLKDEQYVYYQADRGEIDSIHVKAGDTVKKGDKLLSYENKQLDLDKKQNQLQINSVYNDLDKLKKEREKIEKEMDKDSDNEMLEDERDDIQHQQQQANNELDQALLQKESVENEVADLIVKADVDGTVLSVDEKAGAQGQLGEEAIIRIGSLENMLVTGTISEYDTMNIDIGQKVELTSDAVPEESWEGEVSYISDLPEEETEMSGQEDTSVDYPIEVTLGEKVDLKPGFKMLVEIITSEEKVSTLPISSVIQEDENNYVYIVENGKAKRVEVKVGTVDTEKMEIKEGVTEENQVIISPSDDLEDGMEVTVE